jgi:hypothetical protein
MMPLRESEIVPLLEKAAELGLKLGRKGPDTLTVQPASRCTPELADKLRLYKWHLLHLLKLNWLMAYSQTLKETIFFCDDDDTRNVLIEAGAAPCCVYTLAELRSLLVRHREAPLSVDELLRFHQAKRLFNGQCLD